MVQYEQEHGGFRVLPLRTCVDLALLDMEKGVVHPWTVVDFATTEGDARRLVAEMKKGLAATPKSRGNP